MSDDFKSFLEDLSQESKRNLDRASVDVEPKKVNSVYAPLGQEAAQPTIRAKREYGPRRHVNAGNGLVEFAKEYPGVYAWVANKAADGNNEFATSLHGYLARNGTLTEKQIAAVERAIGRDLAFKTNIVAPQANAIPVDVSRIEEAFTKAQENDIARPKMSLADFQFSLAPATGVNAGAIYVKQGDLYLGKIKGGRFLKMRECDDETAARVVEVASNPHEAAKAYGQRTGNCSCCGRTLTKHASIDAQIGPICAQKYGWM